MNLEMLDNPIWHALSTYQNGFAVLNSHAKILHPDIGLFCAIQTPSAQSFEALHRLLLENRATTALFSPQNLELPVGFECLRTLEISQMVGQNLHISNNHQVQALTSEDVPEMLELVQLTKPGPFGRRTIELGQYWGIRVNRQLVAMTGERLHLPGFREVSSVCTHPDFQRQGFAQALIAKVCQEIVARAEIPFLHVMGGNTVAAKVYEQLGFVQRTKLFGYVLRAKSSEVTS
jgi:predicted GNAT family acetyltransferase